MLVHVPRLVTLEIGSAPASLCAEELLAIINEIADLTVGVVRFELRDADAIGTLLRVADHAQYRDVNAIISLPHCDEQTLRAAMSISPAAIALPLQKAGVLRDAAAFTAIAHHDGIPIELETHVTPVNAHELVSIASVASALHANRWRIDFSGVRTNATYAAMVLAIAGRGTLAITVHALPQLRLALLQQMTADFRVPDLRRLSSIDRSESIRITHDGAAVIPGRTTEIAGSVRRQTVAGIFNGSASYLRLRARHDSPKAETRLRDAILRDLAAPAHAIM